MLLMEPSIFLSTFMQWQHGVCPALVACCRTGTPGPARIAPQTPSMMGKNVCRPRRCCQGRQTTPTLSPAILMERRTGRTAKIDGFLTERWMAFKPLDSSCSCSYTTHELTASVPPVSTSLVPNTTGSANSDRRVASIGSHPRPSLDYAQGRGSALTNDSER